VEERTATLDRLRGDDGEQWLQVRWQEWGRELLLRSRGGREELLRMMDSFRREGP
jgi:hypothetical protein